MNSLLKRIVVFTITATFVFNSGLGQILSYADTSVIYKNTKDIISSFEVKNVTQANYNVATTSNVSTNSNNLTFGDFTYTVNDSEVTITGYTGNAKRLTIPSEINNLNVTAIGTHAFEGCSSLEDITILPVDITTIGEYAFSNCSALKSITLPRSITTIGEYAFEGCNENLRMFVFQGSDAETYAKKNKFSYMYISDSIGQVSNLKVTKITENSIQLDWGVTEYIAGYEIYRYDEEKNDFVYRDSVKSDVTSYTDENLNPDIEYTYKVRAFRGGKNKTYGDFSNDVSAKTSPKNLTFGDFTYTVDNSEITITGYTGNDQKITIPSEIDNLNVTTIGAHAFDGCSSLKDITILPEDITSIGEYAFSNYSALTSITLPRSITTIDEYAFSNCSALTSITLPENITTIGKEAFSNCSALTSIILPGSIITIDEEAFKGCKDFTMFVPQGSDAETYAIDNGFKYDSIGKVGNLEVTEITENSIQLKWDEVDNVSGYEIYKFNEVENKFEKINTVTSGVTSYTDENLNPGTKYSYKVRAYKDVDNNKTYGYFSNEVKPTTESKKDELPVIALGTIISKSNVRSKPSIISKKLGYLPKKASVEIVGKSNGWYKIKYNGSYGYVSALLVKIKLVFGSVIDKSDVRSKPLKNSKKLGELAKGTDVEIVGKLNSWYKIKYNGSYGYVNAKYVKASSVLDHTIIWNNDKN